MRSFRTVLLWIWEVIVICLAGISASFVVVGIVAWIALEALMEKMEQIGNAETKNG